MTISRNNYYYKHISNEIINKPENHILYNTDNTNQNTIGKYVSRYASCNHKDKLNYLAYRAGQAFRALNGNSDWQKARTLLVKELREGKIYTVRSNPINEHTCSKQKINKMAELILKREKSIYNLAKFYCVLSENEPQCYSFNQTEFKKSTSGIRAQMLKELDSLAVA